MVPYFFLINQYNCNIQGCQRTLKTLKTLKSLENEMVTLNDLEMLKYQERTLKSLDFYFSLTLKTLKNSISPLLEQSEQRS